MLNSFVIKKLGRTPDERITKQKTQRAYENLYMGPEFIIDFRYSQVNSSLENILTST